MMLKATMPATPLDAASTMHAGAHTSCVSHDVSACGRRGTCGAAQHPAHDCDSRAGYWLPSGPEGPLDT
eukprot:scaffold80_cov382-Prasinococcus_capsulatus_cf.AAC.21